MRKGLIRHGMAVIGIVALIGLLASCYTNRGYAYDNKGDYDRAIADFTQAIRLDPNDADARRGLEEARQARGW